MEAATINNNISSAFLIEKALAAFFKAHTTDDTQVLLWKFFQCWTTKDCALKAEISDEEVALFFDQLMDLVAAAYILHQANRALIKPQEGERHE